MARMFRIWIEVLVRRGHGPTWLGPSAGLSRSIGDGGRAAGMWQFTSID